MYPDLPGGFSSYAVIASIAMSTALLYNYFKLDELSMTFKVYALYCIICAAFAVITAKILYGISILPSEGFTFYNFIHNSIFGGIVFYGGLFGVAIGILVASRFFHRDGMFILDFVSPSFALFHSIARFACLFGGCCYGIPWSWGVVMAETPDIIRFPVQIAESICCIITFIILLVRAKRINSHKGSFRIYMLLYACCRFFLEFFRGDTDRGIWFLGLSTSQIISIIIILVIISKDLIYRIKHA